MSDNINVGEYKFIEFSIKPIGADPDAKGVDIKHKVTFFSIEESITKGFVSGKAVIEDTFNDVQNIPLNGEELLTISYSDFFGDLLTEDYFIYSVVHDEMNFKESDTTQKYTIYFCSIGRLLSSTQLVRKGFNSSASEAANELFKMYFEDLNTFVPEKRKKILRTNDSGDILRLVVPSYSPIDAMHFLSRQAVAATNGNSSSFRFFESRHSYWFAPVEFVVSENERLRKEIGEEKMLSFFIFSDNKGSLDVIERRMYQIQGLKFGTRVNTIKDMDEGIYRRRLVHVDINMRETTKTDIDLEDIAVDYTPDTPTIPRHSKSLMERLQPERQEYFVIKDWVNNESAIRPNPSHHNVFGNKAMQILNDRNNEIEIVIHGRNSIVAGSVIELNLPLFEHREAGGVTQDEERSGTYLVKSIVNEFSGDMYKQFMVLTRSGVGAGTQNKNDFLKEIPTYAVDTCLMTDPIYGAGANASVPSTLSDVSNVTVNNNTTSTGIVTKPTIQANNAVGSIGTQFTSVAGGKVIDTPAGPKTVSTNVSGAKGN